MSRKLVLHPAEEVGRVSDALHLGGGIHFDEKVLRYGARVRHALHLGDGIHLEERALRYGVRLGNLGDGVHLPAGHACKISA